ncbi:MAG: DUF4352 domain-containing protein [Rubrobacteraceae bacterium]
MPRWLRITGIGCGGFLALFIVIGIVGVLLSDPSVDSSEEVQDDSAQEQAGQDQQAEEGGENTVTVGEPLTVGETAWIVTNAEQTTQLTDEFGESETGNFVVVDYEFTNNSSESITLDSSMLTLTDSQERENEPDTDKLFYTEPERDLFLEQVNPGVSQEGTVIFTVADDASGFVLELAGGFFSGEAGYVDLGY